MDGVEHQSIVSVAAPIATLLIAASGFLLMMQVKAWAARAFLAGVGLAAGAALLGQWPSPTIAQSIAAAPWPATFALAAVVAAALRQYGAALALASPLAAKLLFLPALGSLSPMLAIAGSALAAIGLAARMLTLIVGKEAAGHVVGVFIVRFVNLVVALIVGLVGLCLSPILKSKK
jgi:hypothetical protein